ncbi:hypothetical protein [uncultured Mailhella sp.]|uniref:hypothetical protein n=1 Tax=uncultured Mailhella sp. TaxID=1981031 RepID=UPI0025E0577E|nr:hypothetical protein [uncultured Mailhella sp.]
MDQIGRNSAEHAAEYIGVVRGSWPLIALAAAVAVTSALCQMRRGFKQRTVAQKTATVLVNACLTTSLALGCAFLLPLIMPDATVQAQMGVVCLTASLGAESLKLWIIKKLGLSVVDLMNPDDINEIRKTMDPETRKKHAAQCPFRLDECATREETQERQQRQQRQRGE